MAGFKPYTPSVVGIIEELYNVADKVRSYVQYSSVDDSSTIPSFFLYYSGSPNPMNIPIDASIPEFDYTYFIHGTVYTLFGLPILDSNDQWTDYRLVCRFKIEDDETHPDHVNMHFGLYVLRVTGSSSMVVKTIRDIDHSTSKRYIRIAELDTECTGWYWYNGWARSSEDMIAGLFLKCKNPSYAMSSPGIAFGADYINAQVSEYGHLDLGGVIYDPNEKDPGGPAGPGGGGGKHDPGSDVIIVPDVGPINALSARGLINYYRVTLNDLANIGGMLYSEGFLNAIHNWFSKPQDMIAGLMLIPVSPPCVYECKPTVGNQSFISVEMDYLKIISQQYMEVNMGSIYVDEYYGSFLDFSPNTKLELHLPFLGTREIDPDEVMGQTINLKYHIDCYNGDCVAFISVLDRNTQTYGVRYQFSGSCGQQIPVTSADFSSVINNAITLATTAVGAIMSGGTTIPAEAAAGAVAAASVNAVMDGKAHVAKSGNLGASTGIMSVLRPYIVKTVPRQSLPDNYRTFEGYPANFTAALSSMEGFTVVDSIHLHGIPCTDAELSEIEQLLKTGVEL